MTPSVVTDVGKPFCPDIVVLPAFKYAAIARPEAMPVILGCGIDFIYLPLFGLFFFLEYARLAVFLTCPLRVDLFPFVRALDAL